MCDQKHEKMNVVMRYCVLHFSNHDAKPRFFIPGRKRAIPGHFVNRFTGGAPHIPAAIGVEIPPKQDRETMDIEKDDRLPIEQLNAQILGPT
jgi:hypothetical protein